MEPGTVLILLLLLACPLAMIFMHRGHGGHASHGSPGGHTDGASERRDDGSLDEFRRRRVELDAQIARLEETEESDAPVATSGR